MKKYFSTATLMINENMIIITITWDDKSLLALTKSDHSKIWSVLAAVVSSKSTLPSTESSRSSEPIYIIRKKALRPLELINGWTLSIVKERNSYILHQLPNGRRLVLYGALLMLKKFMHVMYICSAAVR